MEQFFFTKLLHSWFWLRILIFQSIGRSSWFLLRTESLTSQDRSRSHDDRSHDEKREKEKEREKESEDGVKKCLAFANVCVLFCLVKLPPQQNSSTSPKKGPFEKERRVCTSFLRDKLLILAGRLELSLSDTDWDWWWSQPDMSPTL